MALQMLKFRKKQKNRDAIESHSSLRLKQLCDLGQNMAKQKGVSILELWLIPSEKEKTIIIVINKKQEH